MKSAIDLINSFFNIRIPYSINYTNGEILNQLSYLAVYLKSGCVYEFPENKCKIENNASTKSLLNRLDKSDYEILILTDLKYLRFGSAILKFKLKLKINNPKVKMTRNGKYIVITGDTIVAEVNSI